MAVAFEPRNTAIDARHPSYAPARYLNDPPPVPQREILPTQYRALHNSRSYVMPFPNSFGVALGHRAARAPWLVHSGFNERFVRVTRLIIPPRLPNDQWNWSNPTLEAGCPEGPCPGPFPDGRGGHGPSEVEYSIQHTDPATGCLLTSATHRLPHVPPRRTQPIPSEFDNVLGLLFDWRIDPTARHG